MAAHRSLLALRRWPVLAGMALLVLPWLLAGLDAACEALWPGAAVFQEPALAGVAAPAPRPKLDAAGLASGAFQAAFTAYFDQNLPLLSTAVRLKNQLYFSLLGQSGLPDVVVGKHLQLYEQRYIDEYCRRDTAAIMAAAEPWAARLAQMQRWYAARGKVFVYVITPSKAATDPQDMPDGRACRSPPADRDRLLPAWDAMLERHGVRYADMATLIRRAAPAYGMAMFPRGGTHWNEVAAALGTQALIGAINGAGAAWTLPGFTFTWRMAPPAGIARDLTDLLNLPFPRLDYAAPVVSVIADAAPMSCRPVTIGAVGGSFTFELIWTLMKLPCPPRVEFYSYFRTMHAHFPGDQRTAVDPAQRAEDLLVRADVIVLEENEQVATRSEHGPAFYDWLAGRLSAMTDDEP